MAKTKSKVFGGTTSKPRKSSKAKAAKAAKAAKEALAKISKPLSKTPPPFRNHVNILSRVAGGANRPRCAYLKRWIDISNNAVSFNAWNRNVAWCLFAYV